MLLVGGQGRWRNKAGGKNVRHRTYTFMILQNPLFSGRRKNKTGGTSILFRAGFWLRSGMGSCLTSVCMVKMSLFSSFNKINVAYLSVK